MFYYVSICAGYVLVLFDLTSGQRRIINGEKVDEKKYVAYFVKAENSQQEYDAWLCGGAIVTPVYIVTSAACVEDVQFMYVIAGYKKYVKSEDLNTDECTKRKKKKVIFVCTPKAYEFSYPLIEKWSKIDIAVAKVESPFDFNDQSYLSYCSYIPNKIPINYERKYQEPGQDCVVFGWGHPAKWRSVDDSTDYNQKELHGTSVRIQNKAQCKQDYGPKNPMLLKIIDSYMICTMHEGNINARGDLIKRTDVEDLQEGCGDSGYLRGTKLCDEYQDAARINSGGKRKSEAEFDEFGKLRFTRRNGICQVIMALNNVNAILNDHGGPLVTWVGAHEVLIGVASVFRINSTSDCIGPFLFTSTWCNSAFLNCIVEEPKAGRRLCDLPPEKLGYTLMKREVSWAEHPDGPAANERKRPAAYEMNQRPADYEMNQRPAGYEMNQPPAADGMHQNPAAYEMDQRPAAYEMYQRPAPYEREQEHAGYGTIYKPGSKDLRPRPDEELVQMRPQLPLYYREKRDIFNRM